MKNSRRLTRGTRKTLLAAHDRALMQCAFPADAAQLRAAERALGEIAHRAVRREESDDSGMAGSTVETGFSLAMTRWLVQRFPSDVEIAWSGEAASDAFEAALPLLAAPVEANGLAETSLSTETWCRSAAGPKRSGLSWVLERVERLRSSESLAERLFESLDLDIRWVIVDPRTSRGGLRFPRRELHYHRGALLKRIDLAEVAERPLPTPRRLTPTERDALLEAMRLTLLVRGRETDPVTDADPDSLRLYSLERGIDVALVCLSPARRLPLEAYIGFVVARNRVPVGYGGAWVFFDRAEIGVNIFPEFRGGESSLIFGQVLRCYAQACQVQRFFVDPYQFGRDNNEAIRSGAFWFYHRLGFRPVDPLLAQTAADESARLQREPGARTPPRMLRRFAADRLRWERSPCAEAPDPAAISWAVTRHIGATFNGDLEAARRAAVRAITRRTGVSPQPSWTAGERHWFGECALAIAPIGALSSWTHSERTALAALMRAKGRAGEWEYSARLRQHRRLRQAWSELEL